MVVDGVEGGEYDEVGTPLFSADSRRVAYAAQRDHKWVVVVDGMEGKEYYGVAGLQFSPDSRRVAYAAQARGTALHLGKLFVVVDGVEENEYDMIYDLQFSADSGHVAYAARRGTTVWGGGMELVVVDGAEGKEYDSFLNRSPLVFDGPEQLHALAQLRTGEVFRVEMKVVTAAAEAKPTTVAPPAQPSAQAAPAAARQAATVKLSVVSTPDGADITVDGSFMGNTPSAIELAPGEHTIVVAKQGYAPWQRRIRLAPGDIHLNAELQPTTPTSSTPATPAPPAAR
jgi:hypothetical protein